MQSIESIRRIIGRRRSAARGERGATATEYIIILVLIAVAAITVWNRFGTQIRAKVAGATAEVEELDLNPDGDD